MDITSVGSIRRAEGLSPFVTSILDLLDRVDYRRCETDEDFEIIRRIRHEAYATAGIIPRHPSGQYTDGLDDLPNSHTFCVYLDGQPISTIRLNHITAEQPFGSVMELFSNEINDGLAQGETYVYSCIFAVLPEVTSIAMAIPYLTLRLIPVAASHFNPSKIIGAIRLEHTTFFCRTFDAVPVGEIKTFPQFTPKIRLLVADHKRSAQSVFSRYPFFKSSPVEQELLFGERPHTSVGTPVVHPSARLMSAA